MSLGINSSYGNYANPYTGAANRTKTAEVNSSAEASDTPKTAMDELTYLQKKFGSGYSILSGACSYGMTYGSANTTNVMIDPRFLQKMANDPELAAEYEDAISHMRELDEQFSRSVEAGGWHVAAQGWAIDKDGGMSGWCITQKDDTKSYTQKLSENMEKINQKRAEKKEEEKKKLDKVCKEKFGDMFKEMRIMDKDEVRGRIGSNIDIRA